MRVLFLDCDGVLNSRDDYKVTSDTPNLHVLNWDKIDLLLKIVEDTGCKIVLSSSWRQLHSGLKALDDHNIPVYDTTAHLGTCRGAEIQEWLDRHPETESYAIVDDDSDILIHQWPRFVHTDFLVGMNETIAYRVTARLKMPKTKTAYELCEAASDKTKFL